MDNLTRECPHCRTTLTYPNKYVVAYANERNSLCRKCCQIKYDEPKKCIDCGRPILRVSARCRSCSHKGEHNWVTKNGGLKPETIDNQKKRKSNVRTDC